MCCRLERSFCIVQCCSNTANRVVTPAGNANGAPLTSQGQFEGVAVSNALPVSAEQMGAADPMALVQALQALPKVSACHMLFVCMASYSFQLIVFICAVWTWVV